MGVRPSWSTTRSSFGAVDVRTMALGLLALLTDTLLATPTVALATATSSSFASRRLAIISARLASPNCRAECGGVDILCMRCSGEGASSGAEDGCEQRALILVTFGCRYDGERVRGDTDVSRASRASRFEASVGFVQISHSGSRSSRWSLMGMELPGDACATIIVTESASESKLRLDVGVNAGCKYGDAAGLSIPPSIGLSLRSGTSTKFLRLGDFAGSVLVRLSSFFPRTVADPESGEGARPAFVAGNSDNRGEGATAGEGVMAGEGATAGADATIGEDFSTGEAATIGEDDTIGEVALR